MEPVETQVKIPAKVVRVEKRSRDIYVSGYGDDAVFHKQDMGWWVIMEGSRESLYIGEEQPTWKEGDMMEIIIRRRNVQPSPTSK